MENAHTRTQTNNNKNPLIIRCKKNKKDIEKQKIPTNNQQQLPNLTQLQKWKHLMSLQHLRNQIKASRKNKTSTNNERQDTPRNKKLKH